MRVGFIGSGKVATAFGLYLKDKNQTISGYYSRTLSSAIIAAKYVQTETFQTLEALANQSDWIGITVSDDQIEAVTEALSTMQIKAPKVFFHMSGAKSSKCLYPLKVRGHHCLSIHPLQTISEVVQGKELLGKCLYTIEGDESAEIEQFLKSLDRPTIRITADQKPYYHAAACMASNYLYTLTHEAMALMKLAGFSEDISFEAIRPLMEGTLENMKTLSPQKALTGPIARGDVQTVSEHVNVLKNQTTLLRVYKQMGLATLQLASLDKLKDSKTIEELETILQVEEESIK